MRDAEMKALAKSLNLPKIMWDTAEFREHLGRLVAASQGEQAKPLTDEQIGDVLVSHLETNGGYHQFARAVEAAHGIGEQACKSE